MGFIVENGIFIKYDAEPGETEVVVPAGVTAIASYAFAHCSTI